MNKIIMLWLDWIQFKWTLKDKSISNILYNTRTELENFIILKKGWWKFEYRIDFFYKWTEILSFYKWTENFNIKSYDKFKVHWKTFILFSNNEILTILEKFFFIENMLECHIYIDFNTKLENLIKNFTWYFQYSKSSFYINKYSRTENRRFLICLYDKKAEIIKKNLTKYYEKYFIHKDISRFEIRIRSLYAKNLNYKDLINDDNNALLKWIIKNYSKKYTKMFETFFEDKIILCKKKYNQNIIQENIIHWNKNRLRLFQWIFKNLVKQWISKEDILSTINYKN